MISYRKVRRLSHPRVEEFIEDFERRCKQAGVSPRRKWRAFFRAMQNADSEQGKSPETIAQDIIDVYLNAPGGPG